MDNKMNKIKNLGTYIVRIANIKKQRAEQYIDYLLNEDHDNHIGRTEILNTIGEKDPFVINNKLKLLKNKASHKKKGGRPLKVSDKSLTFNIPKDYDCSDEQLIEIQMEMFKHIRKLYIEKNIPIELVDFFTNIHNQKNKHINLVIPYLDQNGKIIPFIKSNDLFLQQVAKHFTKVVDDVLGTNIMDYMTELDQMAKSDEIMANIDTMTLSEIQELKKKHKDNKLVKRTLDYMFRILSGIEKNEDVQKHINNLEKTISKVGKDKKLTKEEFEDFKRALQKSGLMGQLSPEGREKVLNAAPSEALAKKKEINKDIK
jgi:hypothetical protein